jgi:hypothetical protein
LYNNGPAKGGQNGGRYGCSTDFGEPGNGGSGANDIRVIGGSWDDSNGLLSSFIVTGGGCGGGEDSGNTGGYCGGISGGINSNDNTGSDGVFGKGAHTNRDGGDGGGWISWFTLDGSQTIPTSCTGNDANSGAGGSGYVYTNTSEVYNGYLVPKKDTDMLKYHWN